MDDLLSRLARLDRLRALDLEPLRAGARHWRTVTLDPGALLWKQGRAVDSVGLVLAGELSALVDGVAVARAHAGDLIGELATVLPRAVHPFTLRADTRVEVALLSTAAQLNLRAHDPQGLEALTRHALRRVAARTLETYAKIALFRDGALARPRREFEGRIGHGARRPCRPDTPPAVISLLARIEPLQRAGEEAITTIAGALAPIRVCAGDIIALAGDDDPRVLLVVDGAFDVLLPERDERRAAPVAQVGPPALLGAEALAGVVTRSTSIVAASSGWLFALDAAACDRLPAPVRMGWIEAALASASTMYREALRTLCVTAHAFSREHPHASSPLGMTASDSMTTLLREWGGRSGDLDGHRVRRGDP